MKKLLIGLLFTAGVVGTAIAGWSNPVTDVDQFNDSVNIQRRIVSTDGSMTLILNTTTYKHPSGKIDFNSYLSLQSNTARFRPNQHNDGGIYSRIRVDNNPPFENVHLSFFSNTAQSISITPPSGRLIDNSFVQNVTGAKQRILIQLHTARTGSIWDSEIVEFRI